MFSYYTNKSVISTHQRIVKVATRAVVIAVIFIQLQVVQPTDEVILTLRTETC